MTVSSHQGARKGSRVATVKAKDRGGVEYVVEVRVQPYSGPPSWLGEVSIVTATAPGFSMTGELAETELRRRGVPLPDVFIEADELAFPDAAKKGLD